MVQTLNDVFGAGPSNSSPAGQMLDPELYTPQDMEENFEDFPQQPFKDPRQPTQVRVAAAGRGVPVPAKAPEMSENLDAEAVPPMPERGERSPNMQQGPLVQQQDSRYQDVTNVIMADVITGGLLPWIQASADVATGRVPVERFDEARMEHEKRIEELKAGHQNIVSGAEKAMPFLSGLGIGLLKPARTVVGTAGRAAAVGGAEGAVQGFTGADPELASTDPKRLEGAVAQSAQSAVLGAVGGALPGAASAGKGMVDRRAARVAAEDEQARKFAERQARAQKAKQTKQTRERQKQLAADEQRRDDQLISRFESYRNPLGEPTKRWKENRNILNEHPEHAFREQARRDATLESFSRNTNLSPVSLLQKLRGKDLPRTTPQERSLYQQLQEVDESWQAVRRRGTGVKNATDAAEPTGNSPGPTPASGGPAAKPAAGGRSRKPAAASPSRKPGDEPIRTPRKPQRDDPY